MSSIKFRVVLGLSLIVGFFILQATLVWSTKDQLQHDVVDVTRRNTIATVALSELSVLAQQIRRYEKEYFVYVGNESRRSAYAKEWTQTHNKISSLIANILDNKSGAYSLTDLKKAADWRSASDFYGQQMQNIFATVESRASQLVQTSSVAEQRQQVTARSDNASAQHSSATVMFGSADVNEMIKDGKDRFSAGLIKGVAELQAEKSRETLSLADIAAQGFDRLLYGVLISVALGVVVALLLIFLLPQAVTSPVERLASVVDAMSRGQLDSPLTGGRIREFELLEKALERMRLAQQAMVARLRLKK